MSSTSPAAPRRRWNSSFKDPWGPAWSPDGTTIVSADGGVKLIDAVSGQVTATLIRQIDTYRFDWSPDSTRIAFFITAACSRSVATGTVSAASRPRRGQIRTILAPGAGRSRGQRMAARSSSTSSGSREARRAISGESRPTAPARRRSPPRSRPARATPTRNGPPRHPFSPGRARLDAHAAALPHPCDGGEGAPPIRRLRPSGNRGEPR